MRRFLIIFTLVTLVVGLILTAVYFSSLPTAEKDELSLISSRTDLNSFRRGTTQQRQQVVCQDDVKLCEDGTYVSRDPAKGCNFTCGSTSDTSLTPSNRGNSNAISCPQDVKQCSDGSYVARDVNRGCEFKACPISKETPRSTSSAPVNCGQMDVNQDGKLDIIDFQAFLTVYGKTCADTVLPTTGCGGKDTNLDGKVDDTDFLSYLDRFNKPSCIL